jgi:hypothetical protein
MKNLIALTILTAGIGFAQNVPMGQELNQNGTILLVEPIAPLPPIIAELVTGPPSNLYGLIVSVAPSNLAGTVLSITAQIVTVGGTKLNCSTSGPISQNSSSIFSTVFIITGTAAALDVAQVLSIQVNVGTVDLWGAPSVADTWCHAI